MCPERGLSRSGSCAIVSSGRTGQKRDEDVRLMRLVALALATSLGVGYIPFAPGTFGSLVGLLIWWVLPVGPDLQLAVIAVLFVAGSWSASVSERHFKSTD